MKTTHIFIYLSFILRFQDIPLTRAYLANHLRDGATAILWGTHNLLPRESLSLWSLPTVDYTLLWDIQPKWRTGARFSILCIPSHDPYLIMHANSDNKGMSFIINCRRSGFDFSALRNRRNGSGVSGVKLRGESPLISRFLLWSYGEVVWDGSGGLRWHSDFRNDIQWAIGGRPTRADYFLIS